MKRIVTLILALAMILCAFTVSAEESRPQLSVVWGGNMQSFLEGEDENNNYIIHYIEDESGVDLTWNILPTENGQAKLNVMMASKDEAPDILFTGRDNFLNYYNEGMLQQLDDYLPEGFLPEDVEAVAEVGVLDGGKYAITTPGNQSSSTHIWMYNKALMEQAGITVPENLTLDEFTDILYKLKEAYPDKIILGGMHFDFIQAAFGIANTYRETADGALEDTRVSEDMREYLAYMQKLYVDGILDKEFQVNTKENVMAEISNDEVVTLGVEWYTYTGGYRNVMADDEGKGALTKWAQVAMLDGGRATKGQTTGGRVQYYCCVTYACEDVQAAVNVIRTMCTDDYYKICMYGQEGVDYVYNEDGKRVRTDSPIGKAFSTSGAQFYVYYYVKETKDQRIDRLGMSQSEERLDNSQRIWYSAKEVKDPLETVPNISEYQDGKTDLNDLFTTYRVKFIMNEYPMDKFDDMKAEWEQLGGQEILDALNEWYTNR